MNEQQSPPVESVDLAEFDEAYQEAEVEERDFQEVPDGKYQVAIERVELRRTRETNNPMLTWGLRILGPTNAGQMLWRNNVLASPENLKWLKGDLHTCGLALGKLSDLPNRLDALLDVRLEVQKKTKGEFSNIYINRRIVTDGDDTPQSNSGGLTDDVPW